MVALAAEGYVATPTPEQQTTRTDSVGIGRFLVRESPYILMSMMALGGIAYRGFVGHPILGYWVFLMPIFGVLCIVGGLRHTHSGKEVADLLWMQILHWSALLTGMYILTFTSVRSTLDDNAAALLQLMVLALGTFLAGVSTRSWRVGVVGIVLLLAVPVVSWIEVSSALIVMSLVALLLVVGLLWMGERRIVGRPAV
jgi:hypothetical protein